MLLNDRTVKVSGLGVGNVANRKGCGCHARSSPLTEIRVNTRKMIPSNIAYAMQSESWLNFRRTRDATCFWTDIEERVAILSIGL